MQRRHSCKHGHRGSQAYKEWKKSRPNGTLILERRQEDLKKLKTFQLQQRALTPKLDRETRSDIQKANVKAHVRMRDYYFVHPNEIEPGFKSIGKEFGGAGYGRIDIIGRDVYNNLCLVEIKANRNVPVEAAQHQLLRYKTLLLKILSNFRCINCNRIITPSIRMILITQDQRIDFGHSASSKPKIEPVLTGS